MYFVFFSLPFHSVRNIERKNSTNCSNVYIVNDDSLTVLLSVSKQRYDERIVYKILICVELILMSLEKQFTIRQIKELIQIFSTGARGTDFIF